MRRLRRWLCLNAAILGLALSGCQTWVPEAGMTLPTGRYLDGHYPQYFPQTPPYPLPRELSNLQAASAQPGLPGPGPLLPGGPGGP
jgi:hypothetical protein